MKIAYIAGPYRGKNAFEIDQNIHNARKIAAKYWKLGYAVICPHSNSAHMDGIVPDSDFLEGAMEMLRRSDVVVFCPNWRLSEGTNLEREEALHLGKHIIYE